MSSETRKELERSVRALLPKGLSMGASKSKQASSAAAGVSGLVSSFVWGILRARRLRAKK